MPQPFDATAAQPPPTDTVGATSRPAGWKLVAEAPEPDLPVARDRAGAAGGLWLLLLGGALFWALVAAAVWYVRR